MLTLTKIQPVSKLFFRRNEELDDKSLIRKLRKKIAELEAEIACLRAGQVTHTLKKNLVNMVQIYFESKAYAFCFVPAYSPAKMQSYSLGQHSILKALKVYQIMKWFLPLLL